MPNAAVLLTVHAGSIDAEVQISLAELQAAFGHAVSDSAAGLEARLVPWLHAYLARYLRPQSLKGRPWRVAVGALAVQQIRPGYWSLRELRA